MKSKHELADNEELIGVYGVTNSYATLVGLGYIVKVKPDEDVFTCPASFQIFIKTEIEGREPIELDVKLQDTIEDIKEMLQEKNGLHPSQTTLIFNSERLEDDRTLSYYNIKNDSTIDLVFKKFGK